MTFSLVNLPANLCARLSLIAAFMLCLPLVMGAALGAQADTAAGPPALRAPLNIIPPPLQRSIAAARRNNPQSANSAAQNLLAPQVATNQMKRVRRSVASVPGTTTAMVQVGQLGALEDAPVGLEQGYGQNVWRGARLAFVTDTMARLPKNYNLSSLRAMETRLHRGIVSAPSGAVRGTSWFASRLNRLVVLNDSEGALALAALTGAATSDVYTARAVIEAHLALGARAAACAVEAPTGKPPRAIELFFLERLIMCDLAKRQFDKAALAIELNPILQDDKFFHDVAFALAAQAPVKFTTEQPAEQSGRTTQASPKLQNPPIIIPSQLTIMQFALLDMMLDLVPDALPSDVQAIPVAMRGRLAEDYRIMPELQLKAAFLAVQNGRIDGRKFARISQRIDMNRLKAANIIIEQNKSAAPNKQANANVGGFAPRYRTELQQAVFLVSQLRAIKASARRVRPSLIADTLVQSLEGGFWVAAVRVLQPYVQNMRFDRVRITADQRAILLAAYWMGDNSRARPIANKAALNDPISARLHRLMQLLSRNETGEKTMPIDWAAYETALAADDAAITAYLRMELAVFYGLGLGVPENLLAQISDASPDAAQASPNAHDASPNAHDARLKKLVENQWIGDLVLALAVSYGRRTALDFTPRETADLLTNLREAGLTQEAYALARDILLPHYARLTLLHPTLFVAAIGGAMGNTRYG